MWSQILKESSRLGVTLDVYGAILLAKSVFLRRNTEIFRTSGATFGYNYKTATDTIVAKREAIVGCVLFIGGFTLQYLGSKYDSKTINRSLDVEFLIAAAVLTATSMLIIRFWARKYTLPKLKKEWEKKEHNK
jgi:hypothetical protein